MDVKNPIQLKVKDGNELSTNPNSLGLSSRRKWGWKNGK